MKKEENKLHDIEDLCANIGSKNLWIIGIVAIVLAAFFIFAIFKSKGDSGNAIQVPPASIGAQDALSGMAGNTFQGATPAAPSSIAGAQQAAFTGPNCAPYTAANPCFPQGTAAQQVAFISPNCMACPTVTQCFPPAAGGAPSFSQGQGAQQVAFGQNGGAIQCPFCGYSYNDIYTAARGSTRCPNCQAIAPASNTATNRNTAVMVPPAGIVYPSGAQYPGPGQAVALTQPVKAPPIFRDAVMPHKFRGVCENCHVVNPDIAISSSAVPPHAYRGVCSNCHTILR